MKHQRLGQRYRLIDRIGEGGMAFVYLALDEKLGRKVAVKVLHPHMEKNPDIRKRFQLEAQAISSLDHPNIVKIYDFSGDQSENLWIVTEVITGQNLADYLQDQKNALVHPIIGTCIVREVLKALSQAHAQKIVHRDIKPENVMLTHDGRIKLMDFGIAKDMQHSGMTMTGTFMGSPSYMSPEQIRGKDVDFKSDIYSASVLFYEIVTGKLPFTGKTTHEVVLKIIDGIYTFPRFIVPEITPEVDQLIVKGMSMDPQLRLESVDQYGIALDAVLKKYGFDESNIELERFTKNPEEFFRAQAARVKKTMLITNRDPPPNQDTKKRRKSDVAADQRGPRDQDKTAMVGEPRIFVPRMPTARADSNSVRDQRQSNFQNRSAIKPAMIPQQTVRTPVDHHNDANGPIPPPSRPTLRREGIALQQPPVPLNNPKQFIESTAVSKQNQVAHQYHPDLKKLRAQRQSPWVNQPQISQPALATYLFGFIWVGLILTLSVWGLIELNRYLVVHQRKVAGSATGIESKKPRLTIQAKPSEPKYQEKSSEKTAEKSSEKLPTKAQAKPQPDKGRNPTKYRPQPLRAERVIRPLPTQEIGSLTVEGSTIKQRKIKPVSLSKKPSTLNYTSTASAALNPGKPVDPSAPKESSKETPETKVTSSGKARVQVSSQPASEIHIDGIKIGTTVDSTTNSGWLIVSTGTHELELRRSGYVTHKMEFEVGDDAPLIIPRVELKLEPQATGQETTREGERKREPVNLTVKVSHVPSVIYIRNLETNSLQTIQLKTQVKTVILENSRYLVRVEYAEQFRERIFNTNQSPGNLTFFADF